MAIDVLLALVRANVAAGAAVVMVLALRRDARRLFGAELAYRLWLVVPVALIGSLLAITAIQIRSDAANVPGHALRVWLAIGDHCDAVIGVWLVGVIASMASVSVNQRRFLSAAKVGRAGPAVVGVLNPRLVLPSDFKDQFTQEERALVRAHERAHIDRLDARANAIAVLVQCLCWFNPLLHLAAGVMREDQELACDATVMSRLPHRRIRYAETLLKTQMVRSRLPLGCRWLARGAHPLEARITMLAKPPPAQARRDAGLAALVLLVLAVGGVAWVAQPPQPTWLVLIVALPMSAMMGIG